MASLYFVATKLELTLRLCIVRERERKNFICPVVTHTQKNCIKKVQWHFLILTSPKDCVDDLGISAELMEAQ